MTNEDWRYSEDKLKLRGECLHILLNKFSYDDPNKVNYTTQDIYECAMTGCHKEIRSAVESLLTLKPTM